MIVRELLTKIGFKVDKKAIKNADESVKSFKASAIAATAAVAGLIVGFEKLISTTAEYGDQLDKATEITGLNVKQLQELQGAAGLAGVEQRSLIMAMSRFNEVIGQTAMGTGQAGETFLQLGIDIRDTNTGQIKPTLALFKEVAARLNLVKDAHVRASTAMLLFSMRGVRLLNMMKGGNKALDEAIGRYDKYAFIMNEKAVKSSVAFNDQLSLIKAALTGVKNEVGLKVMPAINKMVLTFLKWFAVNRKILTQGLVSFFRDLAEIIKIATDVFVGVLDIIIKLSEKFKSLIPIVKTLLGIFISFWVIKTVFKLIGGGLRLGLALLNPWKIALLAIFLILQDFIVYLRGGKSVIGDLFKKFPIIKKLFEDIGKALLLPFIIIGKIIHWIDITIKKTSAFLTFAYDIFQKITGISPKTIAQTGARIASFLPIPGGAQAISALLPSATAAMVGPTSANPTVNKIATTINVSVPPGTPSAQQAFLKDSASKAFEEMFNRQLTTTLSAYPQTEK